MVNSKTQQFKQQLPRNMFLHVLSFITNIVVGLCLVPYLIGHLGLAAYGLIPIAGMMTKYVALVSRSISIAVARFLTIALQRDDVAEANTIFNTAFFSYLAIGIVQIPIFGLIVYKANAIFSIPQELYQDAIILLVCSAASFLINLVSSVFSVPMYANNRLDLSRSLEIGRQLIRVTGVVTMFLAFGPALRYVGYVDLVNTVAVCMVRIGIGKHLAPSLRVARRYFDWRKVRQLTGMGGWLLVNHIGILFFLRTDIWVCNRFVSAEAAGDYAAISQWLVLIRMSAGMISGVVAPMMIIYYAQGEIENLIRLSKLSVRLLSFFLAIPISVICVFSSTLLGLWLGQSFVRLSPLMLMMLCPLVTCLGVSTLFNIKTALNKVKWPGLVTLAGGIVNIFLAILFAKHFNWGIYGVAIARAITLILRNAFFLQIYSAVVLGQKWYTFLKSSLSGMLFFGVLMSFSYFIGHYVHPTSWGGLALASSIPAIVGLALAWFLLPKRDRQLITELIPPKFLSIMAKSRRS